MSGLVSGLQNRVRRFESARNLKVVKMPDTVMCPAFFYLLIYKYLALGNAVLSF